MIASPSGAEVIYNEPVSGSSADEKCVFNGSEADCTIIGVIDGVSTTTIVRVARFLKQERHQGYRAALDRLKDQDASGNAPAEGLRDAG